MTPTAKQPDTIETDKLISILKAGCCDRCWGSKHMAKAATRLSELQAENEFLQKSLTVKQTISHDAIVQLQERVKVLEGALERRCDSMAFVINHIGVGSWYDKFKNELEADRAALTQEKS